MKSMLRSGMVILSVLAVIGFIVPSSALAVKEIKIGVIYPLTGGAAAAGRELRAGVELAAKIANSGMADLQMTMAQNKGIKNLGGAKIKLIFKDHEGNPTLGADLAKKLILDDKVDGILGCYFSSVTKTVSAVCEQHGIPMINGSSTSPALTKRGFKWFWRTTPHDINLASACEKTEWGSHVSGLIKEFAKEYDFKLKKSLLYAAKSADLSSEVRSLKASRADVMLFASYTSDAILMVKTLKAQKAHPKIIWGQDAGFEKPEFRSTLGDSISGILTRTVFLPKVMDLKKLAGQVNKLYKEKTGNDLGGASARAFTGLQTWVAVLEKAGSTKPAKIQAAANALYIPGKELVVPWQGIKFSTSGDELGQNVLGSGLIGQYQKGKDGKISLEIVYPFDVSSADMIFPFAGF
ncbi:MAG: ABC transporter substrate-binding protein [Deltaproteobacteria bacterium]|nr:ABC transporter substrate-binding protein [Deltaproteobacteria bacterium]